MTAEGKPFSPAYPTLESLRALGEMWNTSPPMKHFGAKLAFDRVDRVRAVIDPVTPVHRGGLGTDAVNGVVLAGLFDLVIGTVGWLTRPDVRSATVNLSMSFFPSDPWRPHCGRGPARARRAEPRLRGGRDLRRGGPRHGPLRRHVRDRVRKDGQPRHLRAHEGRRGSTVAARGAPHPVPLPPGEGVLQDALPVHFPLPPKGERVRVRGGF